MEEKKKKGGAAELPAAAARFGFSLLSIKAKAIILAAIAVIVIAAMIAATALIVMASFSNSNKQDANTVSMGGVCNTSNVAAGDGDQAAASTGSPTKSPVPGYPDSVMPVVQQIIATSRANGFPDEAAKLAITTAIGESSLGTNEAAMSDPNGDGDMGYYQQRTIYRDGAWYGTPEQVTDINWATATFLNGTDNEYGHMRGLKDVKGWAGLAPEEAIHRVQRNDPDTNYVYAKNYELAVQFFNAAEGGAPASLAPAANPNCAGTPVVATGDAAAVVAAAQTQVGLPYVFGGGSGTGPSTSNQRSEDAGESGFDCSGITSYGYQQGAGITLPRVASDQWAKYQSNMVPDDQLQPGDLLFYVYGRKGNTVSHTAMYVGDGKMIEASHGSNSVRITTARTSSNDKGYVGAARVLGADAPQEGGDAK